MFDLPYSFKKIEKKWQHHWKKRKSFEVGQKNKLNTLGLVGPNGVFTKETPIFNGLHIFKSSEILLQTLKNEKSLLSKKEIIHSYPHSWRSKTPLIYRTTPQWFISMNNNNLRTNIIKAINNIKWYPQTCKNRILSMIQKRPDWCISRQRVWGVPLSLFIHKETGKILKDSKVRNKIIEAYKNQGSDIWFKENSKFFLEPDYNPEMYEPIMDVLDVWFDSGCSHAYVLEKHPELSSPADLYLEGSDQHRGWFQVSLIESCATRNTEPFKNVLTHGFTLDEKGYKMSKSSGNNMLLEKITKTIGAEILRIWVASSDITQDIRIGQKSLKHYQDIYRKFRNTFRYLLGGLKNFSKQEIVNLEQMPELERWVLSKLASLTLEIDLMYKNYEFKSLFNKLYKFCSIDLSAFYFNIRKDSLYCDSPDNIKRRSIRTVFFHILDKITRWLSPVLCFMTEEIWQIWGEWKESSVHLSVFQKLPKNWRNKNLEKKYNFIRHNLKLFSTNMEEKRKVGLIGSSLQAKLIIFDPTNKLDQNIDWAEILIASTVIIERKDPPKEAFCLPDIPDISVVVEKEKGNKCKRCWKISTIINSYQEICKRCSKIISNNKYYNILYE